jgi:hypothetical protein
MIRPLLALTLTVAAYLAAVAWTVRAADRNLVGES